MNPTQGMNKRVQRDIAVAKLQQAAAELQRLANALEDAFDATPEPESLTGKAREREATVCENAHTAVEHAIDDMLRLAFP